MDGVRATASWPLSFSYRVGLGVSGILCRSARRAIDNFGHSPSRSARAHEIISERYGRSVRIQGNGPVSVARILHVA